MEWNCLMLLRILFVKWHEIVSIRVHRKVLLKYACVEY